jgi:hypothetical protein
MITVIRTATAFPGMTGEAVAWAKEIGTIVKRATGKEQIVCTAFAGLLSDIAWIGHYDGVAEYDELRTKVLSDQEYVAAAKKARNLFVPGSERDQVWKHE